jgi:molecular chaperone GrpE
MPRRYDRAHKIEVHGAEDGGAPASGDGASSETDVLAAQPSEVQGLRQRIEELERELREQKDQNLRTVAEFQNTRRRLEERTQEAVQFANRELILGMLPVLDNFERAMAAAEQNKSYEALIGGVALTMRQLQDFLKKHGVEPIDAIGKEFDPNYHEAVVRVEDSEHPENTVVDELQRGYTMHSRVLRPSMVKVAKSE